MNSHTLSKDKVRPTEARDQPGPSNRPLCSCIFIWPGRRFFWPNTCDHPPQNPLKTPPPSQQNNIGTGAQNPAPHQWPTYNNNVVKKKNRPSKPVDLSNIKCFRCGEMGHYVSHHDKDNNLWIHAAYTAISNDVHEDDNDNDSIIENGLSEGEENYEAVWQKVRNMVGNTTQMSVKNMNSWRWPLRQMTWTHTMDHPNIVQDLMWSLLQTSWKQTKATRSGIWQAEMCLSTYTNVNGIMALMLWDSGSTSTAMSPHFADISWALVFNLTEPVTLQLGTVRSCSKINFDTMAKMELADIMSMEYVDVVNIDRYDLLIGTPFIHWRGVILDFKKNCVSINGVSIPAEVILSTGKVHDVCQHWLWQPLPPARGNWLYDKPTIEVLEEEDTEKMLNPLPTDFPALMSSWPNLSILLPTMVLIPLIIWL